jgi:hypothetical protein
MGEENLPKLETELKKDFLDKFGVSIQELQMSEFNLECQINEKITMCRVSTKEKEIFQTLPTKFLPTYLKLYGVGKDVKFVENFDKKAIESKFKSL